MKHIHTTLVLWPHQHFSFTPSENPISFVPAFAKGSQEWFIYEKQQENHHIYHLLPLIFIELLTMKYD